MKKLIKLKKKQTHYCQLSLSACSNRKIKNRIRKIRIFAPINY